MDRKQENDSILVIITAKQNIFWNLTDNIWVQGLIVFPVANMTVTVFVSKPEGV